MRTLLACSLLAVLTLSACAGAGRSTPTAGASPQATLGDAAPPTSPPAALGLSEPLRLVVLGDGYTYGTGTAAPNRDSWPAQLQQVTRHGDMRIRIVRNLAVSGDTSDDVLQDQLPQVESYQPDLVTVQVGANDIFTGTGIDAYRDNLEAIFDGLLAFMDRDRVFAITTPDHELTERGRAIGPPDADSADVAAINAILHEVAAERDIAVVDIAPIYELVVDDPTMVLDGGPDPSARQYAGWVELIGQRMRHSLTGAEP